MRLSEFERLVYRHQDRVYGFALRLLGRREDAQDVTQDVLIRLWRRGDEVDAERVLPWLMRVTRNACIDRLRRRQRGIETATDGLELDAAGHDRTAHDGAGETASAVERLERADDQAWIERALDGLAEPYRSVVILREMQEMKYEEIAAAMDMPLNTVKVYIHRGRKMLRERLMEVSERERV